MQILEMFKLLQLWAWKLIILMPKNNIIFNMIIMINFHLKFWFLYLNTFYL